MSPLASYPGSVPVRVRKIEPRRAWYTLHVHVQKISKICKICNLSVLFRLRMTHSGESVVCVQRIAVAFSLCQRFVEDMAYALSQL